jgi:hypothetical protein
MAEFHQGVCAVHGPGAFYASNGTCVTCGKARAAATRKATRRPGSELTGSAKDAKGRGTMTLAQAREAGVRVFLSDSPCRKGHAAPVRRLGRTGECYPCRLKATAARARRKERKDAEKRRQSSAAARERVAGLMRSRR